MELRPCDLEANTKSNIQLMSPNTEVRALLKCVYYSKARAISEHEKRVLAKAGDVVIFVGLLQHCAMPNHSKDSRSVILIQYLPKWVRPMEDQKGMLTQEVSIFFKSPEMV